MIYEVELDDIKIMEIATDVINEAVLQQLHRRYTTIDHLMADLVKEIVYSKKDEIIEKVVDRASKEITKKGLPKLMEKLEE